MHRGITWEKWKIQTHKVPPQVLPSFREYTPPATYPEEVEETLGTPIEVEPLDETQLENLGLNICNHDLPLSSREVLSFDEPEPQPQPFPSFPSLEMYTKNGVNPPAPNPAHNSNFSLLLVLGRERLTNPNYMDWMRNLRFTLRYENKEYVLDEQITTINDDSTQEEIEAHQKHYDDATKVSCIIVSSMSPELQKSFENTWAYEMNQQLKEMFQAKASK
ncbi:hypothetical protein Tco_1340366 [Tanacetum coccineum]